MWDTSETVPSEDSKMPRGIPRNKKAAEAEAAKSASAGEKPGPKLALSVKTRAMVDAIREQFTAFVDEFHQMTVSRAELAPKFMKAFAAWQVETGGTFVGFVRLLDPKVPEGRDAYRATPTYQAADYLRRLLAQADREPIPEENRPVSAYLALAHLVATILPAIDPNGVIWQAFVREMNWSEAAAERLKTVAAKAGAIKLPPTVKHRLVETQERLESKSA